MSAAEATFRPQADGRSAIEDTIEGELVHEVYQTMRVTSFFMLLFGAVWTLLTRGKVPEWALYGWVGSLVVFVLLFHVPLIFLYHRYREARSSRFWMRTIEWAAVAGSTIYGALPWLLFPHVDQTLAVCFYLWSGLGTRRGRGFLYRQLAVVAGFHGSDDRLACGLRRDALAGSAGGGSNRGLGCGNDRLLLRRCPPSAPCPPRVDELAL